MCKDNIFRYNYAFWDGGVLELWKNSNITKLSFRVRNFNTVMFITDSNRLYYKSYLLHHGSSRRQKIT